MSNFAGKAILMNSDDRTEKQEAYALILKKLPELLNPNLSRCANFCLALSVLKEDLDLFWVGLYEVNGDRLCLTVFQGSSACTEIEFGRGACGEAAQHGEIVNLPDVQKVSNYIACHPETRSEIVIPGIVNGKTSFVLDVDSDKVHRFTETDEKMLVQIVKQFEHIAVM